MSEKIIIREVSQGTLTLTKPPSLAGVLQLFLNFDSLRQKCFRTGAEDVCPRSVKIVCLYAFFVCDWYWVVLMWRYEVSQAKHAKGFQFSMS